ncbi:MAG TPA: peptidase S53, partial [Mycobacterium sp.]
MSARHWSSVPVAMAAVASALILLSASGLPRATIPRGPADIAGPFASLLASSSDLGPSRSGDAQLTVALPGLARPARLLEWSDAHGLSVRWRPGDAWAVVEGAADDLGRAFDVPVRDYRGRKGQVFYASPQQPDIPAALSDG